MRIISLLSLISLLFISACNTGPEPRAADSMPSLSYVPYVSAFSSGLVGARDPIRVEFPYVLDGVEAGTDADPTLLTIEPAVKGTLRWERRSLLTFVPSESLRQNTTYTATVALGKIRPEVPDSLAKFQFSALSHACDHGPPHPLSRRSTASAGRKPVWYEAGRVAVIAQYFEVYKEILLFLAVYNRARLASTPTALTIALSPA